jgi:hypothetical protein
MHLSFHFVGFHCDSTPLGKRLLGVIPAPTFWRMHMAFLGETEEKHLNKINIAWRAAF